MERQVVRVQTPCLRCVHEGVCTIQEQIESDLVLTVVGIGRPVDLTLDCSLFRRASEREITRRTVRDAERARPGRRRMAAGAQRRWDEVKERAPTDG